MTRIGLSVAVLLVIAGVRAAAAEVETRTFQIKVDGKPAGEYYMVIRDDAGTYTVTGQADVKVRYYIYNYTYSYRGTEVWKDGRLQRLDSQANDDGKQLTVSALADGGRLIVRANGIEHGTRPDAWTTTYWHLADPKLRNQAIILLDADTGKEMRAVLQFVGEQAISVAGQVQNCVHYRLTGGVKVELWYDAQERLVRQEAIEDGHKTSLELVKLHR